MDGETVALAIADAMDVLPRDQDAPAGGDVRARNHLEQRGLAGAVGAEHAYDLRALEGAVHVETEGRRAVEQAAPVHLAHALQGQQRASHQCRPPNICRLRSGSRLSAAASPFQVTWP